MSSLIKKVEIDKCPFTTHVSVGRLSAIFDFNLCRKALARVTHRCLTPPWQLVEGGRLQKLAISGEDLGLYCIFTFLYKVLYAILGLLFRVRLSGAYV
jgi:hypothetical protein